MDRKELIDQLYRLQAVCVDDNPATAVILNVIIGALASGFEKELMDTVMVFCKGALVDLAKE